MTSATAVCFTAEQSALHADRSATSAAWLRSASRQAHRNNFDTISATTAPDRAAHTMREMKIILFRLSLVGGGEPAFPAISSARSRSVPSLTVENSGFTKKITRSKYSQVGLVISTT